MTDKAGYSKGYAAGLRRAVRTVRRLRGEVQRLRASRAAESTAVLPQIPATEQQPDRRARLHIIVPGPCQGIDVLWERELDADDLEMARDQIVATFNRWIAAKKDQPRRASAGAGGIEAAK